MVGVAMNVKGAFLSHFRIKAMKQNEGVASLTKS